MFYFCSSSSCTFEFIILSFWAFLSFSRMLLMLLFWMLFSYLSWLIKICIWLFSSICLWFSSFIPSITFLICSIYVIKEIPLLWNFHWLFRCTPIFSLNILLVCYFYLCLDAFCYYNFFSSVRFLLLILHFRSAFRYTIDTSDYNFAIFSHQSTQNIYSSFDFVESLSINSSMGSSILHLTLIFEWV